MNVKTLLTACALMLSGTALWAQNFDDVLKAGLLSGWRETDGSHMAAIRFDLADGWHTYWRAPGDAGIPPRFDLSKSQNVKAMQVIWPVPEVYVQNGLRSIIYRDQLVLPIRLTPRTTGADITLDAKIEIGICKDICIPQTLNVRAVLPAGAGARDGRIAAALASRPFSGAEAGASRVRCSMTPTAEGMTLTTAMTLPRTGAVEAMVIETGNPLLWVAEPQMTRKGNSVTARTEIQHVEGAPFVLNRSELRITVLSASRAVEIKGCTGG